MQYKNQTNKKQNIQKGEEACLQWILVMYYNVAFYLAIKNEADVIKFSYLKKRIEAGERMVMRDIYIWCREQRICVRTKFKYLKRLPIKANLWNLYSYMRAKIKYESCSEKVC